MLPLALSVSWIVPGAVWYDTDGNRIDAHGGQILRVNDTFFWVRQAPMGLSSLHQNMLRPGQVGSAYADNAYLPNIYSSSDLMNWKHEGTAAPTGNMFRFVNPV